MKKSGFCVFLLATILVPNFCSCDDFHYNYHYRPQPKSVYEFSVKDLNGREMSLSKYKGFVLIIVNIVTGGHAQRNIAELNILQEKYYDKGLRILAFPCDQFSKREVESNLAMKKIIKNLDLKFEVFSAVKVNGDQTSPLWRYLKYEQGGYFFDFVSWNFTKFIVDRYGLPVERLSVLADMQDLEEAIVPLL